VIIQLSIIVFLNLLIGNVSQFIRGYHVSGIKQEGEGLRLVVKQTVEVPVTLNLLLLTMNLRHDERVRGLVAFGGNDAALVTHSELIHIRHSP
jgi:hypothetical protein